MAGATPPCEDARAAALRDGRGGPLQDVSDKQLARRCAEGESRAWVELVRRHDRRVTLVLLRVLGAGAASEVADVRQEVYARLLVNGGAALRSVRAERPGALAAFVAQTALRAGLDHARAKRSRPSADESVEALFELPGPDDPEREVEASRRHALVSRAVLRLAEGPEASRDLLVYRAHFQDGLSPADISRMGVGLSPKGVETLLRRAREKLVALLREGPTSDPPPASRHPAGRGALKHGGG